MDRFLMEELRNRCSEINSDLDNPEMISKVCNAYLRICDFANIGRKEGLLALEEAMANLDLNDETERFWYDQMNLVVDGTEPKLVKIMGANRCVAYNLPSYLGLINLLYVQGSLMIQAGNTTLLVEQMLKSMMPKVVADEICRRERENEMAKATDEMDMIEELCKSDKEVADSDNLLVCETDKTLIMLSDKEMQRLLAEIGMDNSMLAVVMKGMSGAARRRVFDNLSPSLAKMLADDMIFLGPVRMKRVEEDCVRIMKILLVLNDNGEIVDHDFTILRVVIDMFEMAEKENRILRDKYKDLRAIINRIYND